MRDRAAHRETRERSQLVWGSGDYRPTGRQLAPASEALVEAMAGMVGGRVLDVAAGDGNCAIAAARRGGVVTACDQSAHMIEAGLARTREQGLDIAWVQADAAELPFADASFDAVTSVFGAVFAPEQELVASELLRLTRPGGTIGLTSWVPGGFTSRLVAVGREDDPLPSGDGPDPMRWGSPEQVEGMFPSCATRTRRRAATFAYSSWQECRASLEAHGMSVVAGRTMSRSSYERMFEGIRRLVEEYDYGRGEAVVYDAEYLEVLVTRP